MVFTARWIPAFAHSLLLTAVVPCAVAATLKLVLILHSFERGSATCSIPASIFRITLARKLGKGETGTDGTEPLQKSQENSRQQHAIPAYSTNHPPRRPRGWKDRLKRNLCSLTDYSLPPVAAAWS